MLLADRVEPELLEALRARSELSADARQALTIQTSWDDKASRDRRRQHRLNPAGGLL